MQKKKKNEIEEDICRFFPDINYYQRFINKYLSKPRLIHSHEVAELSYKIATHYNLAIPANAYIAGLFHDVAKDLDFKEHLNIAHKYNYKYSACELDSPATLHAPVGMLIVKNELNITSSDILLAIEYHTTGRSNMTMLEKIVYLADIAQMGKKLDHALIIKKMVYSDIDASMYLATKETLRHLLDKEKIICEKSLEAYNFYSKLTKNKGAVN